MGQRGKQFVVRWRNRAFVLARRPLSLGRRYWSLLKLGSGQRRLPGPPDLARATEVRQELSETHQGLVRAREQSKHWRERAKGWEQEARRLKFELHEAARTAGPSARPAPIAGEASLYLDLLKRTLTGWVDSDGSVLNEEKAGLREQGLGMPTNGQTMIGLKRLDNLQYCIEDTLATGVPGDLIETGVWRGGATILMRAVLKTYGVEDRRVWVADSFEGLPPPDPDQYKQDKGSRLHTREELAVSLEQVKANFERYGLLDEQVCFLKGWFRDTLPEAPIERLAVVRLDGDMYESTMDGLVNLYPRLSAGGYLIVDDYGAVGACRQAVHDYREAHAIHDEIRSIDWTGVFWQRSGE